VTPRLFAGTPAARRLFTASATMAVLACVATPGRAQTSENVAVVINRQQPRLATDWRVLREGAVAAGRQRASDSHGR
jgi:hypothetical protein